MGASGALRRLKKIGPPASINACRCFFSTHADMGHSSRVAGSIFCAGPVINFGPEIKPSFGPLFNGPLFSKRGLWISLVPDQKSAILRFPRRSHVVPGSRHRCFLFLFLSATEISTAAWTSFGQIKQGKTSQARHAPWREPFSLIRRERKAQSWLMSSFLQTSQPLPLVRAAHFLTTLQPTEGDLLR